MSLFLVRYLLFLLLKQLYLLHGHLNSNYCLDNTLFFPSVSCLFGANNHAWATMIMLLWFLSQLHRNPLLSRKKHDPAATGAFAADAPAGAAAEAAKIALKGQISSDFHDAFGVHLGTITAHRTRSRNVVVITHNFVGDSTGLCMSNTSYLKELPEIHFTGKSRLEDTFLPLSTSSTRICVWSILVIFFAHLAF